MATRLGTGDDQIDSNGTVFTKKKRKKVPVSYGNRCRWAEKEGGGMAGWLGWLVKENNDNKKTYTVLAAPQMVVW